MRLGAQATELLEVIAEVWGPERRAAIERDAQALAEQAQDPKSLTRKHYVYAAAGLPMPQYAREELAFFLVNRTELDARRKMTPEIKAWLVEALQRLRDLPSPPG